MKGRDCARVHEKISSFTDGEVVNYNRNIPKQNVKDKGI